MAENRNTNASTYNDDSIQTLAWNEHIRQRPGMYVGRFGDGSQSDDGMYVLIKEVMDNSIDEYMMGHGKTIEVTIEGRRVTIRDYGRGIPLNKLADAVSKMNTGGKFEDSTTFRKSVGLNGVGVKAVNALSSEFTVRSVRDGQARTVSFSRGYELSDRWEEGVQEKNGLWVSFVPDDDEKIFGNYAYNYEFVEPMFRRYTYLNPGLTVKFNGKAFLSKNGLLDLLNDNLSEEPLYPPIHLTGEDIEVVITHGSGYGETYYSFVNGQYTTLGGTHQAAFREAVAKTVKEFYKKDYEPTCAPPSSRRSASRSKIPCSRTSPRPSSARRTWPREAHRCAISSWISSRSGWTTTCTCTPKRPRRWARRWPPTRRNAKPYRASRRRRAKWPRR